METRYTISTAAVEILRKFKKPMRPEDILKEIVGQKLYSFKAVNPLAVLKSELRKHSNAAPLHVKSKLRHFESLPDGTYTLIDIS
jgi:hypothetical protein